MLKNKYTCYVRGIFWPKFFFIEKIQILHFKNSFKAYDQSNTSSLERLCAGVSDKLFINKFCTK